MIIATEYNPFTGVEITYERDSMTGKLNIYQRQRCDEVIDAATRLRNEGPKPLASGRTVAMIPPILALEVAQKAGIRNFYQMPAKERMAFLKRNIVNNRDYYRLRTTEGHV